MGNFKEYGGIDDMLNSGEFEGLEGLLLDRYGLLDRDEELDQEYIY